MNTSHFIRRSRPRRPLAAVALSVALLAPVTRAAGQTLAQQTRRASVDGPSHVISINPFLPLFGYFAAEYEQKVTSVVAVALSGSHIKPNDTRYTNVDAKVRFYPSETALSGLNFAASLGVARIHPPDIGDCFTTDPFPCIAQRAAFTTGSFAIEMGYQRFLGPSKVTAVTVGGGAKRYLGSDEKFRESNRVIPTLRLTLGYAF